MKLVCYNIQGFYIRKDPSKHTTSFQRCNNVVDAQTTLYQRQNDVVCLLGYTVILNLTPYDYIVLMSSSVTLQFLLYYYY